MPRVEAIRPRLAVASSMHRPLAQSWQNAWRRYWRWRAAKTTVSILSALSNRTLKDIGMDRSEIGSVVYGALGEPARSPSRRITCARAPTRGFNR